MPRPRLHKSSVVVGIVVGVILVMIMVPGRVVDGEPWFWITLEHGWPFNYLRREAKGTAPAPRYNTLYYDRHDDIAAQRMLGIPWLGRDNWLLWEAPIDETWSGRETPRWEFSAVVLACDLAIALLVLVSVVSIWEFRRRRRPNLLTFRISDMLVVVASLNAVLGWLVYQQRGFQREERIIERESERSWDDLSTDHWYPEDEVCIAPVFVRSLIGEHLLPEFLWQTYEINIDVENGMRANVICEEIFKLDYLTEINVWGDPGERFPFESLCSLTQLNTLDISSYSEVYKQDVSELTQLTQLKKIVLHYDEENPQTDVLKRLETELPNCRIVDGDEDW